MVNESIFSINNDSDNWPVATAEDLDKLISLAENVSSKLREMDEKASGLKQKSFWVISISYTFLALVVSIVINLDLYSLGAYYKVMTLVGLMLIIIPAVILFFNIRRNLKRLQKDIQVEESVLKDLLSMLHELENASRYRSIIDPVSSAAFKIRIRRLNFALN
ncbi:hypothetical protein [Aeromonas veronii]|uniref:hypothetical protein n=1 Tax=Aeromonas veronii TaxID=654 RepID=UPI003B9F569B